MYRVGTKSKLELGPSIGTEITFTGHQFHAPLRELSAFLLSYRSMCFTSSVLRPSQGKVPFEQLGDKHSLGDNPGFTIHLNSHLLKLTCLRTLYYLGILKNIIVPEKSG